MAGAIKSLGIWLGLTLMLTGGLLLAHAAAQAWGDYPAGSLAKHYGKKHMERLK